MFLCRFHAVYWPAFLRAAGLPLPQRLIVHGHWTVNKTKVGRGMWLHCWLSWLLQMSKSLGNVVDPDVLLSVLGTDMTRYFLMKEARLENDAGVVA